MSNKHPSAECVRTSLEGYFRDLDGTDPAGMHDMLVKAVEKPLLEVVMQQSNNNQSRAGAMAGIEPQHPAQEAGRAQTD